MKFTEAVDLLIHNLDQIIGHFVTDSESDLKDLDPDWYEIVRDANRYARMLRKAMEKMSIGKGERSGLDYRLALTSSAGVNTPGLLKWAMNGYRSPSQKDREAMVRVFAETYGLPSYIARGLVSGELPHAVEGDKVVINIKIDLGVGTMTTADLKRRLAPGVRVLLVQNLKGRCRKLRWVIRQTARDCVFGGPDIDVESYLAWPKKGELFVCIGGFIIAKDGNVHAKYQWVDGSPNTIEEYESAIVVDPKPPLRIVTEEMGARWDLAREIQKVLADDTPEPMLDMASRYLPCIGCERPMWLCECLSDIEWWKLKQGGF